MTCTSNCLTLLSMRFLQIMQGLYLQYPPEFYACRPRILEGSYEEHRQAWIAEGFWGGHIIAPYMEALGYEWDFIVDHPTYLWHRLRGLPEFSGPGVLNRITSMALIKAFQPDVAYLWNAKSSLPISSTTTTVVGWCATWVPPSVTYQGYSTVLTSHARCGEGVLAAGAPRVDHFLPGVPLGQVKRYIADTPIKHDIVFSGQADSDLSHRHRVECLEAVARSLKEGALRGRSAAFYVGDDHPELLGPWREPMQWGAEMYRACASGRIVLNIGAPLTGGNQAGNMRLFEAASVGRCLITDHYPNISDYFEPGKEVVTFTSPQDLVAKIDYYTKHPEEAAAIGLAGQRRCAESHSMEQRAQWLHNIITDIRGGSKE